MDKVVYKIENNIPLTKDDMGHDFKPESGDLYYSIHWCSLNIDNIKNNPDGTKDIYVHLSDTYDYTEITTSMSGKELDLFNISLGSLANDAATVSTKFDSINPYKIDIYFTIRR